MPKLTRLTVAMAALSLSAVGCGDEAEPQEVAEVDFEGPQSVATAYTDWPVVGTVQKPTYGGCRYRATEGEVWTLAADGTDDQIQVDETQAGDVVFQVAVMEAGQMRMNARVDYQRALVARSFSSAVGTASWGEAGEMQTGQVVDGTLCFERKLDSGPDPIRAEFSLIIAPDAAPDYITIGGRFSVDPATLASLEPITLLDQAIEVDLR